MITIKNYNLNNYEQRETFDLMTKDDVFWMKSCKLEIRIIKII